MSEDASKNGNNRGLCANLLEQLIHHQACGREFTLNEVCKHFHDIDRQPLNSGINYLKQQGHLQSVGKGVWRLNDTTITKDADAINHLIDAMADAGPALERASKLLKVLDEANAS